MATLLANSIGDIPTIERIVPTVGSACVTPSMRKKAMKASHSLKMSLKPTPSVAGFSHSNLNFPLGSVTFTGSSPAYTYRLSEVKSLGLPATGSCWDQRPVVGSRVSCLCPGVTRSPFNRSQTREQQARLPQVDCACWGQTALNELHRLFRRRSVRDGAEIG